MNQEKSPGNTLILISRYHFFLPFSTKNKAHWFIVDFVSSLQATSAKSRLFLFAVFCRHLAHGLRGFIPSSAGTASASCRSAGGTPCRNRQATKTPARPKSRARRGSWCAAARASRSLRRSPMYSFKTAKISLSICIRPVPVLFCCSFDSTVRFRRFAGEKLRGKRQHVVGAALHLQPQLHTVHPSRLPCKTWICALPFLTVTVPSTPGKHSGSVRSSAA